jgi:hypothetical protein
LVATVQTPVAKFFARYIKETEHTLEKLREFAEQLKTETAADDRISLTKDSSIQAELNLIQAFDKKDRPVRRIRNREEQKDVPIISGLSEARDTLERVIAKNALCRLLPVKEEALEGIVHNAMHVDEHWLNTQFLLAAASLPDKEFLTVNQYTLALSKVRERTTESVIRSFFNRMKKRGYVPNPGHRKDLRVLAKSAIDDPKYGFRARNAEHEPYNVIVKIDIDDSVKLSEQEAVSVLCGTSSSALHISMLENMEREIFFDYFIEPVVNWGNLSSELVATIIFPTGIKAEILAKGIVQVPSEVTLEALEMISHIVNGDLAREDMLEALLAINPTYVDEAFEQKHIDKIPQKALKARLEYLFRDKIEKGEERNVEQIISVLSRLEPADVVKFCDHPRIRYIWATEIVHHLIGYQDRNRVEVNEFDYDILMRKLGIDLWIQFALAYYVFERAVEYESRVSGDIIYPKWEQISKHPHELESVSDYLRTPKQETIRLLVEKPEDVVYEELTLHLPDRLILLVSFIKNRDQYYKNAP